MKSPLKNPKAPSKVKIFRGNQPKSINFLQETKKFAVSMEPRTKTERLCSGMSTPPVPPTVIEPVLVACHWTQGAGRGFSPSNNLLRFVDFVSGKGCETLDQMKFQTHIYLRKLPESTV